MAAHLTQLEGGRMRMTVWHLDGAERAVAEFGRVALDVDQSTGVDGAVQSFSVYKKESRANARAACLRSVCLSNSHLLNAKAD
jgi:hypothetical protein